jgi:hypothetical protein
MVGNVEEPQVDGVAGEAEMLDGVVGRTGLDDDSGAVLAGPKVSEVAAV